jgi:hypothetical protein
VPEGFPLCIFQPFVLFVRRSVESTGRYRLLDMHRDEITAIDETEARRLLDAGFARTYTRTNGRGGVMGLILKVPLSVVTGNYNPERPLSIANYTGTRFIFRQKISTEIANFYSYKHKKMHPAEASEYALARILHSPAVEGPTYRLKSEAECPQLIPDVRGSSHTCGGSKRYRARSAAEPVRTISPLRPPMLALAA